MKAYIALWAHHTQDCALTWCTNELKPDPPQSPGAPFEGIGAHQASCRLIRAALCCLFPSTTTVSRSGSRLTTVMSNKFRCCPSSSQDNELGPGHRVRDVQPGSHGPRTPGAVTSSCSGCCCGDARPCTTARNYWPRIKLRPDPRITLLNTRAGTLPYETALRRKRCLHRPGARGASRVRYRWNQRPATPEASSIALPTETSANPAKVVSRRIIEPPLP